jgi:cation diffusion facilitator CzcD-associated flavoprotein CzcO
MTPDFDVLIIGAGLSGLYQLHRVRELGLSVRVIEAGSDVGGTWYWNRYPGARFDSESWTYGYSFSPEILQEWEWREHFSPQPDNLRYCQFVADRLDLRRDIEFGHRVQGARWDESTNCWRVHLDDDRRLSARFLVTALGALSVPTLPRVEGIDSFAGESMHTARWPQTPVHFEGKRVGVVGTGATGVQTIQEVAKTAAHLTVFQRTANWCAPLHNGLITPEEQRDIKSRYAQIYQRCRETPGGFIHSPDPRSALEVSPEEREAFWEQRYAEPGFGIWMGNFRDVLSNREANGLMSDFMARKIRQRVKDPQVAERLIPRNHGFGTRRLPLETRYYEVYNQPNVHLVDLRETPIQRITPEGIVTADGEHALDMIIFATGFDALTGAYDALPLEGVQGRRLKDDWQGGARTLFGIQNHGFPNLMMVMGPMGMLGNIPRAIEYNVEWVSDLLRYARDRGHTRIEARLDSVDAWMAHVHECSLGLLSNEVDSWMTGVNTNVAGRQQRVLARYSGSALEYKRRADAFAAQGYPGLAFA